MENALLWVAEKADGRPGVRVTFKLTDAEVQARRWGPWIMSTWIG